MSNKTRNKNWTISKVSKDLEEFKLLYVWKNALIKEAKLRKNATNNLDNFKKWYFALLKAVALDDKVGVIYNEYRSLENKTDVQKDWLHEKTRVYSSIESVYEGLPDIGDMVREHRKKVKSYISKDKELQKYKTKIEIDYLVGSEHYLNEQNDRIDNEIGGITPLIDIYSALKDDVYCDRVYDKNGREFKNVGWKELFTHADENVRRNAYSSYYSAERGHRYTLASIMYYIARRMHQGAKLHNYKNEIEWKANAYYNMSLNNYWYIIDQCEKFAKLNVKYNSFIHKIIKNAYDLKTFEPWDSRLEINNIYEKTDDIYYVQNFAIESLSCLGEEYIKKITELYKKGIVSWKGVATENKGGYCISGLTTLDENPIKVRWDGTMTGAITLSHETGHNMKNLYGRLNNEVNNKVDKINVEIASIINQFITSFYLIDKYKKENKANFVYGIYKHIFNYYFDSVCNLGLTCQFRDSFVNHYVKGKEIKAEVIEKIYLYDRRKYFGMSKDEYNKASKRLPYQNIVLDSYATYIDCENDSNNLLAYYIGSIVGLPLAYKIYHGDKNALNRYLKFLKTGNDISPFKATKVLGVDVLKPQIYTESKQLLNKLLNQFIKDIKIE